MQRLSARFSRMGKKKSGARKRKGSTASTSSTGAGAGREAIGSYTESWFAAYMIDFDIVIASENLSIWMSCLVLMQVVRTRTWSPVRVCIFKYNRMAPLKSLPDDNRMACNPTG